MTLDPECQGLATLLAGRGPEPYMQKQLEAGIDLERRRLGDRPYLLMRWAAIFDYEGLSNSLALVDSFDSAVAAVRTADAQLALRLKQCLAHPKNSYEPPWQIWEGRELGAMHWPKLSPPEPIKTVHNHGFALVGGMYDRWYESFIVLGPFPSGSVSRELVATFKQDRFELWAHLTDVGDSSNRQRHVH